MCRLEHLPIIPFVLPVYFDIKEDKKDKGDEAQDEEPGAGVVVWVDGMGSKLRQTDRRPVVVICQKLKEKKWIEWSV